MYGLQTRVSKEINTKLVKQLIKKDKSKRMQVMIKEFDNLKKLVTSFLNKNYPYVSYVYGGFKDIHEQSLKYNIPLLNHDDNCFMCRRNRKKNQKKGFFAKFFRTKDNKENKEQAKESNNKIETLRRLNTVETIPTPGADVLSLVSI
jgi:hypothetical protein